MVLTWLWGEDPSFQGVNTSQIATSVPDWSTEPQDDLNLRCPGGRARMREDESRARERMAAEMFYGALTQIQKVAPEQEPTWLVCRALLPDAERHLRRCGWQPELLPEDAEPTHPTQL